MVDRHLASIGDKILHRMTPEDRIGMEEALWLITNLNLGKSQYR